MYKKVVDFLVDYYQLEAEDIRLDSQFDTDLGLSSFQLIEMCAELEEELGIELDEDELAKVITVGDVVRLLENR